MRAAFTLTVSESRRLIARGAARTPEVIRALESAYIIIAGGTTNTLVAGELLGLDNLLPAENTVGTSCRGVLCVTHPGTQRFLPAVLYRGKQVEKTVDEALQDFHPETVIIKGGNALDPEGNVGVITAGFDGGMVAKTIGTVTSQGLKYIVPIGLEKLIPSVRLAAQKTGARTLDISLGADFGLYMLSNAVVVSEPVALKLLCGVEAYPVAAGGIGGNEGAVIMVAEGSAEQVRQAVELIEGIKGEPPLKGLKGKCDDCRYRRCRYNGMADLPWDQPGVRSSLDT